MTKEKEFWPVLYADFKPDCVASATCVAMTMFKLGYEVRIVCKEHHPGMNHAQAQFKDKGSGKWTWIRMQNFPFDVDIEEFPDKPNIQTWELKDWNDNFFEHEKKRQE